MKKSITYREITVALGIVVALLIALTFWPSGPGKKTYHPIPVRQMDIPGQSRLIQKVFVVLPGMRGEDLR